MDLHPSSITDWLKLDLLDSDDDDEESCSDPEWVVLKPTKSKEQPPPKRAWCNPKSKTIDPPFPWATNHRATVHSIRYLLARRVERVNGEILCKQCGFHQEISFDLCLKLLEILSFIRKHDRASPEWMNPRLLECLSCRRAGGMQPVIAPKKRNINWLFMFLGQTLGCCTLEQLNYFCKHTNNNHRTGTKDHLLYLTYLTIYKQVDPDGLFDRYIS